MSMAFLMATLARARYALLSGALLGAGAVWGLQLALPAKYAAETTLVLSTPEIAEPLDGATYLESRMPTYAELSTSEPVLTGASEELGLSLSREELDRRVVAFVPESTSLLLLTAEGPDPQAAADLANSVAESFIRLAPQLDSPDRPVLHVEVLEAAVPPDEPAGLSPILSGAIGAILGFTVVLIAALIRAGLARLRRSPPESEGREVPS